MRRRDFLRVASGATGAAAAGATATPVVGQETVTVELVDFAFEPGTDSPLEIPPGTTVHFVWETDSHNIVVESQPEDADWAGNETIENAGFETDHTFEVEGEYAFYCQPHRGLGMEGTIIVDADAEIDQGGGDDHGGGGGSEGGGEIELHNLGVPIHAHFVGSATILAIMVTLVFTFFFLKYGESAHTGFPGKED